MKFIRVIKAGIFDKTLVIETIQPTKDEETGVECDTLLTLLEGNDVIGKEYCRLNFQDNSDRDLIEIARGYFSDVPSNTKVIRK